jgi:hypothetical protein
VTRKFQVFVSSTFEDLKEERQQVMLKLLSLSCIPTGMECFNLGSADKWQLIQGVVDDSDFFILILGGRYGSAPKGGKSFTEMEYDYAAQEHKPMAALLRSEPITRQESQQKYSQILRFRRKVMEHMHVGFWETPIDLANKVTDAIIGMKESHQTGGWIRAQTPSSEVGRNCLSLGVTAIYNRRSDAAGDMLADIRRSRQSCRMYSGIYLASLVKNDDFLDALHMAAERSLGTPYQLVYCTLNPAATGADLAVMELWAQRESTPGADELARRIRERGYSRFSKIREIKGVNAAYRFFSRFVLTHSMLVVDDSIVYFTPYDWVHDSGENCITLRLEGGECTRSFVKEADVIDSHYSVVAPEQEISPFIKIL